MKEKEVAFKIDNVEEHRGRIAAEVEEQLKNPLNNTEDCCDMLKTMIRMLAFNATQDKRGIAQAAQVVTYMSQTMERYVGMMWGKRKGQAEEIEKGLKNVEKMKVDWMKEKDEMGKELKRLKGETKEEE